MPIEVEEGGQINALMDRDRGQWNGVEEDGGESYCDCVMCMYVASTLCLPGVAVFTAPNLASLSFLFTSRIPCCSRFQAERDRQCVGGEGGWMWMWVGMGVIKLRNKLPDGCVMMENFFGLPGWNSRTLSGTLILLVCT